MKIITPLKKTVTSCGTYLIGHVEVNGKQYRLEADIDLTWLNIIDDDGRQESCLIDEEGNVISDSGEYITQDWTDVDWKSLNTCAAKNIFPL